MSTEKQLGEIQVTLKEHTGILTSLSEKVEPLHKDWEFRQELKARRKESSERWIKRCMVFGVPIGIVGTLIGVVGGIAGWF